MLTLPKIGELLNEYEHDFTSSLVTIIGAFTHQILYVVDSRDGFVIKYIDDAIISFFPSRVYNNKNKYLASDTSVEYGKLMSNAILNARRLM